MQDPDYLKTKLRPKIFITLKGNGTWLKKSESSQFLRFKTRDKIWIVRIWRKMPKLWLMMFPKWKINSIFGQNKKELISIIDGIPFLKFVDFCHSLLSWFFFFNLSKMLQVVSQTEEPTRATKNPIFKLYGMSWNFQGIIGPLKSLNIFGVTSIQ